MWQQTSVKAVGGWSLVRRGVSLGTGAELLPGEARSTHVNATRVKLPQDSSGLADGLDRCEATSQQSDEGAGRTGARPLSGRLGAKESDGKIFDVGRPLGGELEKLDVAPLHSVNGNWKGEEHRVNAGH